MAATADGLQQQVDEICACCPVLSPAIIPSGYETQDLVELMQNAGRESVQAFEELLEGAGRGVTCCCVCGADGTPSTSGAGGSDSDDEGGEGDSSLYFTVLTALSFKDRTVALERAGFACTQCRALRSTNRMIRFAALRVGADTAADDEEGDAGSRLLALAAHLASVNRAPDSLQASPEGLAVWLQELYCRAHALQVVASNLGGWRCVGPTGEPLRLSRPKDVVAAARALLQSPQQKEEETQQGSKKKGKQAADAAAAGKQAAAAAAGGKGVGKAAPAKQQAPPQAVAGLKKQPAAAPAQKLQPQPQAGAGKKRSAADVVADEEAPRAAGKKAKGGAPPQQAKPAKPAAAAKAPVPKAGKAGKAPVPQAGKRLR
ncbi:hypothetical protein HXX76_008090 [Chlamydomonas incerta]|uniref:Uncharacterized protein n=1 Tax=Chlamydomonas incerta TaxID=51695 RepID=A0A835W1P6_CHLIN|nr:hypothetical protein HXX76_008090 [Chlamydomonas incerta]|eukprot:KAG2433724.1 hypothetical protein HXX76_008090 [Chlamydomonas incerta]